MAGPSTRGKKNPITLGKTLEKDEIVVEELKIEDITTDSLGLGFTSTYHKVSQLEFNLRDLESLVASKEDVDRIGKRLEDFMQKFSTYMMGNHTYVNQGGSSGQHNRHMS